MLDHGRHAGTQDLRSAGGDHHEVQVGGVHSGAGQGPSGG